MKKKDAKYFKSLGKLKAGRLPGQTIRPLRVERAYSRDKPQIFYSGSLLSKLYLFNLPGNTTVAKIKKLFLSENINLKNITLKRKSEKECHAWITTRKIEDALRIQIMCRDKLLNFSQRKVRAAPARQKTSSRLFTEKCKTPAHIYSLPAETFEKIVSFLSFEDQLNLIRTSANLTRIVRKCRRSLIITSTTPNSSTQSTTVSPTDFIDFIRPNKYCQSFFNKIILIDETRCKDLLPSDISALFSVSAQTTLTELNLAGVIISTGTLSNIARYHRITKFHLGETTGPCDRELSEALQQLNEVTILEVANNSWFSTRVLSMVPKIKLISLAVNNCHRLQLDYLLQVCEV